MAGIIRGDAHLDPVSNNYLDLMLLHSTGKHRGNLDVFVTLDFHGSSPQHPGDHALQMYEIVSTQFLLFSSLPLLSNKLIIYFNTKQL